MSPGTDRRGHVLIVDDEHDIADTQALRLRERYETSVAYGGEAALELAGPDVDAILLDRRMPDVHGDEVLDRLRERGYEGAIIMLTAVDPDLNILEMAFDDYLRKPVDRETLLSTLDQHLDSPGEDERLDEFFEITSKIAVLEAEKSVSQLEDSSEYTALKARADELEWQLRTELDDFDDIVETYRDIGRNSG
ncbi:MULTISPECIES: HalX domain-containing protein [Haloarcula]|uniref:DNA-binding protein n=1 Tax=Haloarcula pellucida TaxID=1427151 RepID=A0A830GLI6_9EURY|nr:MULTISPECIES: response regulator [Halomicroarcula]MBX0348448.1 HalX domain-containing protein [Halomicroarcula pellucida]MDS0278272.1 HalX domain-containing protein [Halomicroarcula sp. S1AR25-4]QIO23916.1 response regulator [Haloarcula sp. JP-L23]GGN93304.1 DNA-binding protein [Halomicroarcula pellucida]